MKHKVGAQKTQCETISRQNKLATVMKLLRQMAINTGTHAFRNKIFTESCSIRT